MRPAADLFTASAPPGRWRLPAGLDLALARRLRPRAVVAAIVVLISAVVLSVLGLAVQAANEYEARRARSAVLTALEEEFDGLARLTSDYAFWDEAVDELAGDPDPRWADANIGSYLAEHFGIDASYVVSPEGRVVLAFLDGEPVGNGESPFAGADFASLIGATAGAGAVPRADGAVLVARGEAYVGYASRITGHTAEGLRNPASGTRLLVLMRRLDAAMLEKFRRIADAVEVRLNVGDRPVAGKGGASPVEFGLPGLDNASAVHAFLMPRRPGDVVLAEIAGPLTILLLTLAGFGVLLIRYVERLQAQQMALAHAHAQAERASRAKSEFLARMSHELRTPLTAVIGFSEIIKDEFLGAIGQREYVEYAGDIHDSGLLLLTLINDVLDMSKIEAGAMELCEEAFDAGRLAGDACKLLRERAASAGIDLSVLPPDPPVGAVGDRRLLLQVLINLVSNAVKFTEAGGTVKVSGERTGGGGVRLLVADSGIGIEAQHLDAVFHPFFQVEGASSRRQTGTGLGLSISRAIMRAHGGDLTIASEPGRGTVAVMEIPAWRVAAVPSTKGEVSV